MPVERDHAHPQQGEPFGSLVPSAAGGGDGLIVVGEGGGLVASQALASGLPLTAVSKWYHRRAIHALHTLLPEAGFCYAISWQPVYSGALVTRDSWPKNPDGRRRVIREWQEVSRRVAEGDYREAVKTGGAWR